MWVAPFGNLRVDAYLQLTAAYRSLSRPSSAPSAKASALCSLPLNLMLVFRSIFFVAAVALARLPTQVGALRLGNTAPRIYTEILRMFLMITMNE